MADRAAMQRADRSNSLQRMLELEREAMVSTSQRTLLPLTTASSIRQPLTRVQMERLRARNAAMPQQTLPSAAPALAIKTSASAQLPSLHARRTESNPYKENNRNRRPSNPALTSHPPNLVIDVQSAKQNNSQKTVARDVDSAMKFRRPSGGLEATTPPSIKYSSTADNLTKSPSYSFGDKSSVCQSPSWEAYDRRKKEKKEEKKEEKRGREEAKAASKPRRLSKPPPFSSPYAYAQKNGGFQSETTVSNTVRKPRPMSTIDLTSPKKEATIYRQPRSRAGSFTSLIKSPFEFRRSSIDQSGKDQSEFIGGIKLEMERHDASQHQLDECSKRDEDLHPALRKIRSDQRCSKALKSPPPPPREAPRDTNRRAYPPITRMTAKVKTMSLVSPTAPAVPDVSTIDKWRARVGLKSSNKRNSLVPLQDTPTSKIDINRISAPQSADAVQTEVSEHQYSHKPDSDDVKTATPAEEEPEARLLTPPPPQPPRRSSKRASVVIPALSVLPDTTANTPTAAECDVRDVSSSYNPSKLEIKVPSLSPSWENLQSSVMNSIEKNIRPMPEAERAFWNHQEWTVPRSAFPSPGHSSSSDDSASDGFHSYTAPSTPNTSRPQSEKEFPRYSGNVDENPLPRVSLYDKEYPDDMESIRPMTQSSVDQNETRDRFDPIHAAAMKVMAAFPDMPQECQGPTNRLNMAHEPLRLRSKESKHVSLPTEIGGNGPLAKVFVECCGCKYYHDMPSRLYEAMVNPGVVLSPNDRTEFAGAISMTVRCPWCKHEMSKSCCSGLAAMVYVKERLH